MKKIVFGMIAAAALFAAGCASTNQTANSNANAKPDSNSGVSVAGKKTTIVDWQGRSFGAKPMPDWLEPAMRGDFTSYKASAGKNSSSDVFKCNSYEAGAADLRSAQMRANMAYARTVARELQQSISVFAAEQARAGNITDATRQGIEEVTKTHSEAEITGHERVIEFWQEKIEEDPLTGEKTKTFAIYQIYQIPANTWAQTTAKYVKSVLGNKQEDLSLEQDFVKDLVSEMMADARHPVVLDQKTKEQQVEINKKMADFQLEIQKELAPAQQQAASDQALLQIMNEGKINQEKIIQDAKTERIKANADARKMAYASGNPVYAQAATITAEDKAWADAEAAALELLGY